MSAGERSVRALAPCKVNPHLEILGRRADGYHELDTTMLALELCDEVELRASERPGIEVLVEGPFATADIPRDERNLAAAAAEFVLSSARDEGRARGVAGWTLRLVKRVPSRAGLGGGSSDAAAAMLAAETLLAHPLGARGDERLAQLGSDCVFFRRATSTGFARCLGRGERVEPRPLPAADLHAVVVAPDFGTSTADVYAAFAARLSAPEAGSRLQPARRPPDAPLAGAPPFNRLEEAALAALPALRTWRAVLDSIPDARWCLSGSGSSFFSLCADVGQAREAETGLRRALRDRGWEPRGLWTLRASGWGARIAP
jgi:4-diphosphocytidyl-2-C-methyl-D-erythritol kinase